MAYWITKFGDTTLSPYEPLQDVGMGMATPSSVRAIGGAVDALGSARARVQTPYQIMVRAEDVAGSLAALKTAFYATRAMHGLRDKLYRTPDGGSANSEWVWARLIGITAQRDGNRQLAVPYILTFEVYSPVWYGADATKTGTLSTSGGVAVALENAGNADVRDAVITVTAAGSAITKVRLQANSETDLTWRGTLAAGNDLVVDCGALTIRNDGDDAYSGLTRETTHTVAYWLAVVPGTGTAGTTVTVTRSGGSSASTVEIAFYEGWQ